MVDLSMAMLNNHDSWCSNMYDMSCDSILLWVISYSGFGCLPWSFDGCAYDIWMATENLEEPGNIW